MSRVLLAVDLSYQTYRAAAAHRNLTSGRHFTGGLYGFFVTLAKTIRETMATDLLICSDRKPYLRQSEYPEYKQGRGASSDPDLKQAYLESIDLITGVLGQLDIPIWGLTGFESDDLIGHMVDRHRFRFDMIYAASNDSDLFQLLTAPNFAIYNKGIHTIWTGARLLRELDLTPDQFMLATALQGTHNAVEGIPKVGEKTSRKAAKDPGLLRGLRDQHGALIDRNLRLIKLPHPQLPTRLAPPLAPKTRTDDRAMYRIFGQYDIDVTDSILKAIRQIKQDHGTD